MTYPILDALIIGGGPAGLAVATGLARQLYKAVIFDNGLYRNSKADHMHNVLGWDHQNPAAFRAKAREDLLGRYDTIKVESATIREIRSMTDGTFQGVDDLGRIWAGRKVVLATGVKDIFPNIPGFETCWGRGM